ncbi:MAG: thymidine kinase [Bdellovibrionales bacterium]|nr:thymidine kinase [Bdellovibrionales bacterium]
MFGLSNFGFHNHGQIEVICGCMFSGKTEGLITQLRRAEIAKLRFQVFKPEVDTRYSTDEVASHNKSRFPAINVTKAEDIYSHIEPYTQVVGIDEAQFFDIKIVEVAGKLAESGRRVIVAGLDTDWKGQPFGPMPQLLAVADAIHKQYAICVVCGAPATRTQRTVSTDEQFLLGSTDAYEARCRKHFDPELSLRIKQTKSLDLNPVLHET